MAKKHDIKRQAVVIIHGIGEQKPMETLRSFVEGLSSWVKNFVPGAEKPRYWSRPEGISDIYETRKITMEYFQGNPKTDFYEFYWAHHMRNTSFNHLIPWVWKMITTPVKKVPERLRWVLITIWLFIFIALGISLLVYIKWSAITNYFKLNWALTAGIVAALLFILRVVLWIVKNPFSNLLLNTAGDAARYFNPMPSNIEERSNIRREGITFLRKLHTRTEKKYDRIIVVGHSLGSVIAYDMVRLLWQEMHEKFTPAATLDHKIFKQMNKIISGRMKFPHVNEFQQLQNRCWKQYRENGNNWLITDFITIAGAITHADLYLLNKIPFENLVSQKEFPVCPPVMEGNDKTLFFDRQTMDIEINGTLQKRTVRFLNHAAPFALTRWTNIFFTSDYVGSNGQRKFGKGVKDIEIPRKGIWFIPSGHTNYWDAIKDNSALSHIAAALGFKAAKEASNR